MIKFSNNELALSRTVAREAFKTSSHLELPTLVPLHDVLDLLHILADGLGLDLDARRNDVDEPGARYSALYLGVEGLAMDLVLREVAPGIRQVLEDLDVHGVLLAELLPMVFEHARLHLDLPVRLRDRGLEVGHVRPVLLQLRGEELNGLDRAGCRR